MVQEIKRAINRINGNEMILAADCDGMYYLIIRGINTKSGSREKVEHLFDYLAKKSD